MEDRRILIAEDDEAMGNLLRDVLEAEQYAVTWARDGQEALKNFRKEPFSLVITDIEMPVMDGYELIVHLKESEEDPVIFVVTGTKDVHFVIDVMKKGVYDYLIKPVDTDDLVIKVQRAFEAFKLKRMQKIVEKEREIRLGKQLEWLEWQKKMEASGGRMDKSLFHNMHISFSQGTGFGALITLLNIVACSATRTGDHFVISADMMETVRKNTEVAERAITTFSEIEWIITNSLPLEKISCHALHGILENVKEEASGFIDINGNRIMLSDRKPVFASKFISVSTGHIRKSLYELCINALKFSEKNTDVYILIDVHDNNVSISVVNQPVKDEEGRRGIPMEYEHLVFEPFFRMTKVVREGYNTFDYGLGLTMVEKIIEKHNGEVSGRNITDHSDIGKGPVKKVEFTVTLPLIGN